MDGEKRKKGKIRIINDGLLIDRRLFFIGSRPKHYYGISDNNRPNVPPSESEIAQVTAIVRSVVAGITCLFKFENVCY